MDPDLRSFLWLCLVMLAAGAALAIVLHSPWAVVGATVLVAAIGLLSLTRPPH